MIRARRKIVFLNLLFLMLFLSTSLFAQNKYWVNGSGNWSDPSHWAATSGGPGGAGVPGAEDNVILDRKSIDGGLTITVDVNVEARSLETKISAGRYELNLLGNPWLMISGEIGRAHV